MTSLASSAQPQNRRSGAKARTLAIPPAKQAEFRALTQTPRIALPTLVLAAVCLPTSLFCMVAGFTGAMNIYLACALLAFNFYWFFSVIHDAIHRSVSQHKWLNETIGQVASTLFNPIASLELFRWGHLQHHRHTNDEQDIDYWCHGPAWSLPLRWMLIDAQYLVHALFSKEPSSKKALMKALPFMLSGVVLVVWLIANGHGFEYLMLSLIPSRIAFIFIGFSFFWLPHAHWPNPQQDLRQSQNLTLATTVRPGYEWLLDPLLQFQNYHLVHHVWPGTPFYNNTKVWKLLEPEFRRRDLAITPGFTLLPELQKVTQS
ncbi:MAG TPA: fatty acid desaturase [Dongiaceae bacterium]|nr:fatty acid desaturase [Dongiaceae bacterium]